MNSVVKIGQKTIGGVDSNAVYVIAEIGSNHDGSLERALEHVRRAKKSGADAVKFQSFSAQGLLNPKRPIQNDPENGWETHPAYDTLEKLELPDEWHAKLKAECDRLGIDFMSAPFDVKKARLVKSLGCNSMKIASGELTNTLLLKEVASYGVPIILSSGAATLEEIRTALTTLEQAGCRDVVLLHCVSNYPPKFSEMNVLAVETLRREFRIPVGISDHTPGHTVPVLATAFGSRCVEKHVTFDRKLKGPDHPYALQWEEFDILIAELQNAVAALGDGVKKPPESERAEALFARKGLYAAVNLKAGDTISLENTRIVRHAFGISARDVEKYLGKRLKKPVEADHAIFPEDF